MPNVPGVETPGYCQMSLRDGPESLAMLKQSKVRVRRKFSGLCRSQPLSSCVLLWQSLRLCSTHTDFAAECLSDFRHIRDAQDTEIVRAFRMRFGKLA